MSYLKDFQNDSKFNFGQIWKLQPGHRDSGCIRPWGDCVLCANVGSKFLVTLGLIFSFHFLERIASEHASWAKLPITLGASKAMKVLALNPFQRAWHHWIINQERRDRPTHYRADDSSSWQTPCRPSVGDAAFGDKHRLKSVPLCAPSCWVFRERGPGDFGA